MTEQKLIIVFLRDGEAFLADEIKIGRPCKDNMMLTQVSIKSAEGRFTTNIGETLIVPAREFKMIH